MLDAVAEVNAAISVHCGGGRGNSGVDVEGWNPEQDGCYKQIVGWKELMMVDLQLQ